MTKPGSLSLFLFALAAAPRVNSRDDDTNNVHESLRNLRSQGSHLRDSSTFTLFDFLDTRRSGDVGDLDIRFNKIPFPNRVAPAGIQFPLRSKDYPICCVMGELLRRNTLASSVVMEYDFEIQGDEKAAHYIDKLGGPPAHPNANPQSEFWVDFEHVLNVQILRRRNVRPDRLTAMRFPDLWQGYDIHQIAEAVRDEYPGSNQQELIKWLWAQGVELDNGIVPFRSRRDFIGMEVRLADLNTWAINAVAPMNFHLKWFVGRARPEEVAWQIATGQLVQGVPSRVLNKVRGMRLSNYTDFTAYEEGCPDHPSWPAMHSAASSSSLWLAVVLKDMKPEHYCEALRMDYGVSYARTVAGVHFPTDNIAGLNLGMAVLSHKMPSYFAEKFGSDPNRVRAKLERYSFDWADFDPKDCTIAGVPVGTYGY